MRSKYKSLSLAETFGLTEPKTRVEQIKMALAGDEYTPASKWGLSSLGIFHPALSVKTWVGVTAPDRRIPITNLFNRTQTPTSDGWSVRKTQVRDFRGGTCTYDSHNGTDFAIIPGTVVVSPAPGVVRRISDEYHRGGLKIIIDHGHGLITTSNHLGRALVSEGDELVRGQPIALSAYSGLDALVSFPWSVPHVHFNTWFLGEPVDPFAIDDEESLWLDRNQPRPFRGGESEAYQPTEWDADAVSAIIAGCIDPELRASLASLTSLDEQAVATVFMKNYFPTRFETDAIVYAVRTERRPLLDLPFQAEDFDGIRLL